MYFRFGGEKGKFFQNLSLSFGFRGCNFVYIGETARNAYCRGREHLRGIRKKEKDSVFIERISDHHDCKFDYDMCCGFRMNVRETHKGAFERLIYNLESAPCTYHGLETLSRCE